MQARIKIHKKILNTFIIIGLILGVSLNYADSIYKTLEQMSFQERENAEIRIILVTSDNYEVQKSVRVIEEIWNNKRYNEAIEKLKRLESTFPEAIEGVEISWRKPIESKPENRWAQDIRIGNRDSVYAVAFDVHRATGNLFVIALCRDGANSGWSVNYSTNGGSSWYERYYYSYTYPIRTLSAGIVANHCYVCFSRPAAQNQTYLYRFRATDAQRDSFSNGSYYVEIFSVASPDTIETRMIRIQDSIVVQLLMMELYFFIGMTRMQSPGLQSLLVLIMLSEVLISVRMQVLNITGCLSHT